ncbi:hypothetical protein D3C80_1264000 [compost metagenome]
MPDLSSLPEDSKIQDQLYRIMRPAAVVMYSYTLSGSQSDIIMAPVNPAAIRQSARNGYLSFHFFANIRGASPSWARVIIMEVIAYSDAVMVEKPAIISTPLNKCGTKASRSLLSASINGLSFGLNARSGTIMTARPMDST